MWDGVGIFSVCTMVLCLVRSVDECECVRWVLLCAQVYANAQGIKIIGDMPIYVGGQSADVWANRCVVVVMSFGGGRKSRTACRQALYNVTCCRAASALAELPLRRDMPQLAHVALTVCTRGQLLLTCLCVCLLVLWPCRHLFELNEQTCAPEDVSGVPPDAFSETGQLWGSPLYR